MEQKVSDTAEAGEKTSDVVSENEQEDTESKRGNDHASVGVRAGLDLAIPLNGPSIMHFASQAAARNNAKPSRQCKSADSKPSDPPSDLPSSPSKLAGRLAAARSMDSRLTTRRRR